MGNGPLHIFQSVFGCGFVLRGVELVAAPAAKPADESAVTVVEVAAAVEVDPLPAAAQEMELGAPEAAPAAVEANSPPGAAQEEPRRKEEVRAAPAAADRGLLPMAAQEREMEVPEVERAATTAVGMVPPPEAAPEELQD